MKKLKKKAKTTISKLKWLAKAVAIGLIAVFVFTPSSYPYFIPKTNSDYAKLSVMVVNKEMTSGGSGSVIRSYDKESLILTNAHVCGVVAKGGWVVHDSGRYAVDSYKASMVHDLCLIKIKVNLGINLKIADQAPERFSKAIVAGHPNLLPLIISEGHFSDRLRISVQAGYRECTKEDLSSPRGALICIINGGRYPVIKEYDSQVLSATIMPGSSGSPVFNDKGEIAGVIFAGMGELSYGFIVPQQYVQSFVIDESPLLAWIPAA